MERRIKLIITSGFAVLFFCLSVASAQTVLTKETRDVVTSGKVKLVSAMPVNQVLQLNVVLPLQNRAAMLAQLKAIYTPSNASYHKYISPKQFAALYNPSETQYTEAVSYFKKQGFTITGGQWLSRNILLTGPVALIESTFGVELNNYVQTSNGFAFYAINKAPTTSLSFPLWSISGLDNYSHPTPLLSKRPEAKDEAAEARPLATTGSGPGRAFIGSDMRAAYGDLFLGDPETGAGQTVGIWEYYGTNLEDLHNYYNAVEQQYPSNIQLKSTDNTPIQCVYTKYDHWCDDTEQTLDMTQALGMAPEASLTMYVGSYDSNIFSGIIDDVANSYDDVGYPEPSSVSISWVWDPPDWTANDDSLAELASAGVSVFAASGDCGAYQYEHGCGPFYPAEDPLVISVGGTQLFTDGPGGPWANELSWQDSGGGWAGNYTGAPFAIPYWQTPENSPGLLTDANGASSTLRNGPDVAGNAYWNNFTCADNQPCLSNEYGGTSFAAPMWAGYMALYNQVVQANSVNDGTQYAYAGLFTPVMYEFFQELINNDGYGALGEIMNDVTQGPSNYVYYPEPGYDLVTGYGSPGLIFPIFLLEFTSGEGCAVPGDVLLTRKLSVHPAC